tara:strand:+ start:2475 stop:2978 length:504 start_codon:yes stop_codon:yes gene_type:complete
MKTGNIDKAVEGAFEFPQVLCYVLGKVLRRDGRETKALSVGHCGDGSYASFKIRHLYRRDEPRAESAKEAGGQPCQLTRVNGAGENNLVIEIEMMLNKGKKLGEGFFLPGQEVDVIENEHRAIAVAGVKRPQVSLVGSLDIAVGKSFGRAIANSEAGSFLQLPGNSL